MLVVRLRNKYHQVCQSMLSSLVFNVICTISPWFLAYQSSGNTIERQHVAHGNWILGTYLFVNLCTLRNQTSYLHVEYVQNCPIFLKSPRSVETVGLYISRVYSGILCSKGGHHPTLMEKCLYTQNSWHTNNRNTPSSFQIKWVISAVHTKSYAQCHICLPAYLPTCLLHV